MNIMSFRCVKLLGLNMLDYADKSAFIAMSLSKNLNLPDKSSRGKHQLALYSFWSHTHAVLECVQSFSTVPEL